MKQYRILLYDKNGDKQHDHIDANTAQEAADQIRKEWPGCYVQRISEVRQDWK